MAKGCTTEGCGGTHYAKGLCRNCYGRMKRQSPESKDWYYRRHLKRKFGISDEEARALAEKTRCECCGAEPGERLHVDHDHATGRIRGSLCRRCNFAVAVLDDQALCEALDAYLQVTPAPRLKLIQGGE